MSPTDPAKTPRVAGKEIVIEEEGKEGGREKAEQRGGTGPGPALGIADASREEGEGRPKQDLHFAHYVLSFLLVFFVSYLVPLGGLLAFYKWALWDTLWTTPFTPLGIFAPDKLLVVIATVTVGLLAYVVHLVLFVLVVKGFIRHINKAFPHQEGTFQRDFDKNAEFLKYHHWRGFLSRLLKWKLTRSAFPWLINWAFNYLGFAQVGKRVVFEDQYHNYESFEIGDDAYFGFGSIPTSTTVEGAFGRVVIDKITVAHDCVVSNGCIIPPGCRLGEGVTMLPGGACTKANRLRHHLVYWGQPVIRYSNRRFLKKFFADPDPYRPYFERERKRKATTK